MTIDDGGPAFPVGFAALFGRDAEGMSLRDRFAIAALTGCCADSDVSNVDDVPPSEFWKAIAEDCYAAADAMLAARAKGNTK